MSKSHPPDINEGYVKNYFDIKDYADNYADYYGRSDGLICSRCKKEGNFPDRIMYYHLPTTLDFCEECVFSIELMTRK